MIVVQTFSFNSRGFYSNLHSFYAFSWILQKSIQLNCLSKHMYTWLFHMFSEASACNQWFAPHCKHLFPLTKASFDWRPNDTPSCLRVFSTCLDVGMFFLLTIEIILPSCTFSHLLWSFRPSAIGINYSFIFEIHKNSAIMSALFVMK